MKKHPQQTGERGVALVSTMIVLAVLAIVAVAFMQSATTDRISSRSGTNYYQAQLAAQAGAAVARGTLVTLFARYPDSVTVWQNVGGGQTNEATVLYARSNVAQPNTPARPGQFDAGVSFVGIPLLSGAQTVPLSGISNAMPFDPANMVNLNATNSSRTEPLVGTRSMTNPGAPVAAGQWLYISRFGGETNATNPPIARYAYWVEDESFKVNVNVATNGPRGTDSLGLSPAEVRLDGSWSSAGNPGVASADAATVVADRRSIGESGFPTAATAALAAGLNSTPAVADFRFLTTANSAGLDLSRGGFKRVNINTVTNGDKREALNRIITAITNSNSAPLFGQRFYRLGNDGASINRINAVTAEHAAIYLQKIAANIYDYIDNDDQPTVISNNAVFSLATGRPSLGVSAVGGGLDGTNPVAAMGVENVPRLQEYAVHMRLRSMRWNPSVGDSFGFFSTNKTNATIPAPTSANYEIWLDHYFEFWNPGTRDYTNSPDAFLKVFDQPAWGPAGAVSGPITSNNRTSSEIPLIDAVTGGPIVFPAGRVTVLTTSPLNALNTGPNTGGQLVAPDPSVVVPLANVPPADRVFTGTTTKIANQDYAYEPAAAVWGGGPDFGYDSLFEISMLPRSTTATDYRSGVLIGNNQGIIESHVGLPIGVINANAGGALVARVGSSWNRNDLSHVGGNIANGQVDNVRGGGLKGNATNGVSVATTKPSPFEGDPRAGLEQLEFLNYTASGGADGNNQTRYFNTIGPGATPVFVNNTFGRPNANYVLPTNWSDVSSINPGSINAPLFVRNGPLQTIGELGYLTDPARPYYTAGAIPVLARGGARTLRVGQPELAGAGTNLAWFTNSQTNASRTWASWRLADIFTVTNAVTIPGLINPNGALRDNGAALRAALFGITFLPSPDGAPTTAGRPANVTNVVTNLIARLTNGPAAGLGPGALNPMWERGEISELSVLNSSAASTLIPGLIMSNAFDRGREELVRRSIEMITTRGSIFTVYAVGQSMQVTGTTTNFGSQVRLKQTFEITPQIPATGADDAFTDAAARFAPVTNFTTRVISMSYD